MLFEQLSGIKRNAIMAVIALITIGGFFLAIPVEYLGVVETILGFMLLVFCCVKILEFIGGKRNLMQYIMLGLALLVGLLGFIILISQDVFLDILSWMTSLLPILLGLYGIFHAYVFARRAGRSGWMILVVLSALLVVFGLFQIVNPFAFDYAGMMQMVGGTLIFASALEALSLVWILPAGRKEN